MKRTGILPDKFRLAKGKWMLTKKDGTKEEVESNGTMIVDMTKYACAFPQSPKRP